MRTKQMKLRDKFGRTTYEELVDFDGIVAVSKAILAEEPDNERCRMFLKWVEVIGSPTREQFQEFLSAVGVKLIDITAQAEEMSN